MGQTLTHGIYLPDEGERNCYAGLASNWSLLDGAVGTIAEHTSQIAGKAPLVHTHTKADITDLLNSNFIPSANNSYDLGSSSYQWNNLYAKNYYYNGTEFQNKFVTLDTSQTISGLKYFSSNILHKTPQTIDVSTNPAEIITGKGLQFVDNTQYWGDITPQWATDGTFRIRIAMTNYNTSGTSTGWFCPLVLDLAKDGSKIDVWSTHLNSNLGTSTNKWKTINGINPGALSLPNSPGDTGTVNVNYYDLSGNITVRDGSATNNFTASCDGWIAIGTFATWLQISNDTLIIATTANPGTDGFAQAFLPVRKGNAIRIMVNQTNTTFQSFKLLPCEGNV